jgi:hypothetical protein
MGMGEVGGAKHRDGSSSKHVVALRPSLDPFLPFPPPHPPQFKPRLSATVEASRGASARCCSWYARMGVSDLPLWVGGGGGRAGERVCGAKERQQGVHQEQRRAGAGRQAGRQAGGQAGGQWLTWGPRRGGRRRSGRPQPAPPAGAGAGEGQGREAAVQLLARRQTQQQHACSPPTPPLALAPDCIMLAMHSRPLSSWSATLRKQSRARGMELHGGGA